jgi:hypothetical protein
LLSIIFLSYSYCFIAMFLFSCFTIVSIIDLQAFCCGLICGNFEIWFQFPFKFSNLYLFSSLDKKL